MNDAIEMTEECVTQKVQPLCPVFGECGGCQYQDIPYEEELRLKENQLKKLFTEHLSICDELFESIMPSAQHYHYRDRLDLKLLKTKQGEVSVGFSPEKRFKIVAVDQCPIARREISDFLPELKRQAVIRLPAKYRVANLVVRCGDSHRVHWGGIGRRSLELKPQDYFFTEIRGQKIFYSLDTFFQANLAILPVLMEKIRGLAIWKSKPTFYDLYGGVGLFAIALRDCASRVFLVEESVASIKLAQFNKDYHGFNNFEIISGRVEDHLPGLLEIPEEKENQNVAMIDPPRAGLSSTALTTLSSTRNLSAILYLSCHPESLVRDLKIFLQHSWRIQNIWPLDFFPRTKHIETLVVLKPPNNLHH